MGGDDPRPRPAQSTPEADARWRSVLSGDAEHAPALVRMRRMFRHLPSDPRCKLCYAPYAPPFGPVMNLLGYGRWKKNPSLCGGCLRIMERDRGGAEVELSMLFADLRQSTELAGTMSAATYSRVLNAFYAIASRAVEARAGSVDKYLGDGVFALFIPGFSGPDHAARAIDAALQIQREAAQPVELDGRPVALSVGIGVHSGTAYVGVVGAAGDLTDFTALGEAVNLTERLSSTAEAAEVLISDAALTASGHSREGLTRRDLDLKGVSAPVAVWSNAGQPPGESPPGATASVRGG